MTVGDALVKIYSREFIRWRIYFRMMDERKWKERTPDHHYFAHIIGEIQRLPMAGKRRKMDYTKFLKKFKIEKPKTPEEKMADSKRAWAMVLGAALPTEKQEYQ